MTKIQEFATRRRFLHLIGDLALKSAAAGLGLQFAANRALASGPSERRSGSIPKGTLEESPFVYISPLLASGKESSCHAELWYAWLDDRVVVNVSSRGWKARALASGHNRARVWVGDHGRWKGRLGGRNESFRKAPNFVAQVEELDAPETIDRLLSVYSKKYPAEISSWRERMRKGVEDGSRKLLGYRMLE